MKINGITITELQQIDKERATNLALQVLKQKHGENINTFVLEQGTNVLTGKEKEIQRLYNSLKTATSPEDRVKIKKEIKLAQDGRGDELYDITTGNLTSYSDLSDPAKEDHNRIAAAAEKVADTTELSQIEDQLTKAYSNIVGISNKISQFIKDPNRSDELTNRSQTRPGLIVNQIKDLFGSKETIYGDLERVEQISKTGVLPENISKISGEHPLAEAFNLALEKYVILNKAIQTNTDLLTVEQEGGFWRAVTTIREKLDATGDDSFFNVQAVVNERFNDVMNEAGLQRTDTDANGNSKEVSEALSQNWRSVAGGGIVDIGLFMAELYAFRKLSGNAISEAGIALEKIFLSSKYAKSSPIARRVITTLLKGTEEATTFSALESTKAVTGIIHQPTREEEWATAEFGFALGMGNVIGPGLMKLFPAKTWLSPVMAQVMKSKVASLVFARSVQANAGAFSMEFAKALTALNDKDSDYYNRNPEEFVKEYVAEWVKMMAAGSKSPFSEKGILRAASNDLMLETPWRIL